MESVLGSVGTIRRRLAITAFSEGAPALYSDASGAAVAAVNNDDVQDYRV
jgi:hypothetical protein